MASLARFFWAVAPSFIGKAYRFPEKICGQVFSTPESNEPGVSAETDLLEFCDYRSAVDDEPCVWSNPDLVDVDVAVAVAPHAEANLVAIVVANDESLLFRGASISPQRDPADLVGFEFRSGSAEENGVLESGWAHEVGRSDVDHGNDPSGWLVRSSKRFRGVLVQAGTRLPKSL